MDLDGTQGPRGALTPEERRRRTEDGLCAYCGVADHAIATCPRAAHIKQARGPFPHLPLFPALPAGYPYPPTGNPYSPPNFSHLPGPLPRTLKPHP